MYWQQITVASMKILLSLMTPGNVTCNTGAACGGHNITLTRATYGQRAVQLSIVTTARLTGLSYIVWEILCGKMDNKEGRGSPLPRPAPETGGPAVRKHVSIFVNTTFTMFEGDRLLCLLNLLPDHTLLQCCRQKICCSLNETSFSFFSNQ